MLDAVKLARDKYNPVKIRKFFEPKIYFNNGVKLKTPRFFILDRDKLEESDEYDEHLFYIALHEFYGWDYSLPEDTTIVLMVFNDIMWGGVTSDGSSPMCWKILGTTFDKIECEESVYKYAEGVIKNFPDIK